MPSTAAIDSIDQVLHETPKKQPILRKRKTLWEMPLKRQSQAASDYPPATVSMEFCLANEDLLVQILLFLPAKSLIRFKSVCKKWLSLITSDRFCHNHTLRRPKLQQSLIIQMHSGQLFYLDQTTNGDKLMIPYHLSVLDPHKIVHACHGLWLLESKHRKNSYYVYNPTTRRLRKIILAKRDDFPSVVITLAFDSSKSPYYKVICLWCTAPNDYGFYAFQIEVYDSESHTWKLCLRQSTPHRIDGHGLHFNNYIFWRKCNGRHLRFDIVHNEAGSYTFSPEPYELGASSTYFQEANGHLYRLVIPNSDHPTPVEKNGTVWEMTRGGKHLVSKHLGALHDHDEMESGAKALMMRSGEDGSKCSVITYEPERRRIMAYSYLDEGSELLVDLTCQPVSEIDQVTSAFQFGEVLALV